MSILADFILQTSIVRGIRTLRSDSRFIDQLFRSVDQRSLSQIRTFLKEQPIDLCLNYPRAPLKVPAIVILLKSEVENQAYLGSSMGTGTPDEFSYDGDIADELIGGAASASTMTGEGKLVFGPFRAASGTANTLKITSKQWDTDQFRGRNLSVRIVSGLGVGQIRGISANGENVLLVASNWSTIPDNTSVFEIREDLPEVLGEPSKLYDRRNPNLVLERRGSMYAANYQIQVIGDNQEQTIYLTIILKAIFELSRTFLEGQGIINLKMSATDFLPRTEYQPDFAYMRALNLEFLSPFDIFEQLGPLATSIQASFEAPDGSIITDSQEINVGLPTPSVEGP